MHTLLTTLSRRMAILGGLILSALILLTVISVTGRLLNGALHGDLWQGLAPGLADWVLGWGVGPVNGDVELTEAGIAFAIFCFLPLTHITGAHATVDIFFSKFPPRLARLLSLITAILFALTMTLVAWQLLAGTLSKARSGQTSFLIEFPIWWAYAACLPGAALAALTAISFVFLQIRSSDAKATS